MIPERRTGPIRFCLALVVAAGCNAVVSSGPGGGSGAGTGGATSTGGVGGGAVGGSSGGAAAAGGASGRGGASVGGTGSGGMAGGASGGGGGAAGGGASGRGGAAGSGGASVGGRGGAAGGGASGRGGASGGGSGGAGGRGGAAGGGAGGSQSTAGTSGGAGAAGASAGGRAGTGGAAGAAGSGETTLDPTPGSYTKTCDGSLGVMIDATHFLDGNDEEQGLRLYTRGKAGAPLQTIDISDDIGLSTDDEADLEDAARIGNRVYVIGSHGRNKDGKLERSRYRFFAIDVAGTSPSLTLTVAGYTTKLLDQMLVAKNWLAPDSAVIATLTAASSLSTSTDADLAPTAGGTNIEGLAWAPTASRPNQLLIGLRNPGQGGAAIVVSLLNAADVVGGTTAQFGEATRLDLGGLGIRAMTWSPIHAAVLLIAGPRDGAASPFRLFEWSGATADAAVVVRDITGAPSDSSPEAIVTYPNTRDVQILFDQGDHQIGGDACKDASSSDQLFSDAIVHVP